MRTSGKGNDAVHLGAQYDIVPRCADRRDNLKPPGRTYRNIHEDVDRRGRRRGIDTELLESICHIVGAVGVTFVAELLVAGSVAARNQRIVHARRSILDQRKNRPPERGDKAFSDRRREPAAGIAGMRHRHPLGEVASVERPAIYYLGAVRVDDLERLVLGQTHGRAHARC